jgi:transcription initiation factor TFIIB
LWFKYGQRKELTPRHKKIDMQYPLYSSSTICTSCSSSQAAITDPESGEIICSNCGVVITDRAEDIIIHQEGYTSTFEEANKKARTGTPSSLALHDMGLSTIIGRENKDARGQTINAATHHRTERLRMWDARTRLQNSVDKNLMRAFEQLDRLKEKLGLSDNIVEKAAYIYRKIQERGLIRGRTTDGMLAAAVYSACREMETPRTIKVIDLEAIRLLYRTQPEAREIITGTR